MRAWPIVTPALAARIQQSGVEFTVSRFRGLERMPGNPLGAEVRREGGVAACRMKSPGAPIPNLVLGLGPGEESRLDDIVGWYGSAPYMVGLVPLLADEPLLRYLAGRGLVASSFMTVTYGVPQIETAPRPPDITVQEFHGEALARFAEWVVEIDGVPEVERDLARAMRAAEFTEWRGYVAFVEGRAAARAAMATREGLATLGAAWTNPAFRGRGCQAVLLHKRLADAAAAGCELVTSGAQPGTASERNQQRAGLRVAYTQVNWTANA